MGEALRLARSALAAGEVPVGAVLVRGGLAVASAANAVAARRDPTAHAEVLALRAAAEALGDDRLEGAVLYTTLEPCAMCAAAAGLARVARIVWGADDPKSGAAGGAFDVFEAARLSHRPACAGGVGRAAAEALLAEFFRGRRAP
ncbi:MAG: nucleoside deaminase [Duodenibacillus sp.]|nr:nucleoside deaminase [Duodenibacillus sp.]